MASAKFLEEALSTDVDESAVSAIVGSLENQLVTSTSTVSNQSGTATVINQNHINSAISNGGTVPSQKHGAITNGDSVNVVTTADNNKVLTNNTVPGTIITGHNTGAITTNYSTATDASKANDGLKIVYSQSGQTMTSTGTIITNRVAFPQQNIPNGTIGLSPITPQTVLQTSTSNVPTLQTKQLVIKTSAAPGTATGLVTVPMNVTATVPQINNVGSPTTTQTPNILSNLQVVNVRPGVPTQPQKGQPARVVLSAPQLVGARPGAPVSCSTHVKYENGRIECILH